MESLSVQIAPHALVATGLWFNVAHVRLAERSATVMWRLEDAAGETLRTGVWVCPPADFASLTQDGFIAGRLLALTGTTPLAAVV